MKKRKIIALTLLVAFLCSLCIPGTWAIAEDGDNPPAEKKGMEISKTATPNGDGYTITLEAYATGEKISTEVTKDVPTDIILVLDQSGSMGEEDFPSVGETRYEQYTGNDTKNSNLYDKRHNQDRESNKNLYYELADGSYATVSVTRTGGIKYEPCDKSWTNSEYYNNKNNLCVKVGDDYQEVTLVRTEGLPYTFKYRFPDGSFFESKRNNASPGDFDGKGPLYYKTESPGEYTYTYSCTDADGNPIDIGTSTGADTRFADATLYEKITTQGGNITRLQALKDAVTQFENSVAEKAKGEDGQLGTDDDVKHRIAVVGFAYGEKGYNADPAYTNTELFIGSDQTRYDRLGQKQYKQAFQDMSTTQGQTNVNASIGALSANGATYVDYGMKIANNILANNPVPSGEKRNRVVIVFTDGAPGWSGYKSDVANDAISEANTTRNTYQANVYSVGIFNGADATSAGNQNGSDTQKANWFMQKLSDNKGTPQTPSYYLSASDSATLNNIFQQISDQIQEGGSSINLGTEAVIKDIISPQFQLPADTTAEDIILKTYSYTGENQWSKNTDAMGAKATISDDQVSVTGFDFKENWCGTETTNGTTNYRGNKLVISFNVEVKDGFLGGNGVYTNTSAGVYENSNAEDPLFTFERPQVDVPINDITVTAQDKNVYLLGDLTAEQIKSGATVKAGNVDINLGPNATNYGLEPWQNEYVNITVTYTDKDGNTVTDLNDLQEDTIYTVEVKVTPKTTGTATEKIGNAMGKINVFKPELTFKDGEVYYGADVPDNATLNASFVRDDMVWKHGETLSTATGVTMIGNKPENTAFTMTYTVDSGKTENGKINSKTVDIPVDVTTVKIGDKDVTEQTTFVHKNCDEKTCTVPEDREFLLHPKTCQLTITKSGGDSNEPYVFDVMKGGTKYSEVTIVGNNSETIYELPVGTYTIVEDENWSWRYNGNNGSAAVLTATEHEGSIICTNTVQNGSWLNGYSEVVKNVHNN